MHALCGLSDAIISGFSGTANQARIWEAVMAVPAEEMERFTSALAMLLDAGRFHASPAVHPVRPIAMLVQTIATVLQELMQPLTQPLM